MSEAVRGWARRMRARRMDGAWRLARVGREGTRPGACERQALKSRKRAPERGVKWITGHARGSGAHLVRGHVHPAKVADGLIVRRLHNRIGSLGLLTGEGGKGGERSASGRLYPVCEPSAQGPGFWRGVEMTRATSTGTTREHATRRAVRGVKGGNASEIERTSLIA